MKIVILLSVASFTPKASYSPYSHRRELDICGESF